MQRKFIINGEELFLENIRITDEKISFTLDGTAYCFDLLKNEQGYFTLKHDHEPTAYHGYAANAGGHGIRHIFMDGLGAFIGQISGRKDASNQNHHGAVIAPMPGRIIEVMVKEGDKVNAGDALLIMEAMKLQHTLTAPRDGTIGSIICEKDMQVQDGMELIVMQEEENA